MCENCKLIKDFIDKWYLSLEIQEKDNNYISLKPKDLINLIYNSLKED